MLYIGNNMSPNSPTEKVDEIRKNNFAYIPRDIERLTNLEVLSLCNTNFQLEFKEEINLPNLIHLDIFNCGFPQLPDPFLISSLKEIGFNCLEKSLSENFLRLKNLKRAYFTFSEFESLPDNINLLSQIQQLFLYKTKLTKLPSGISKLKYLSKLYIEETPIAETLPPEILKQSGKEIIRYIFSQLSDAPKFYFNESKMIIVGQGHVGKTSLLNRLVANQYVDNGSTEGIDITSWQFQKNRETYKLNIWDFGGQEIYHSTHQFFLTKRSLYLLVWDAFAEDEYGRIDYWLKTIQSLAGDSPVIIVVNKCDKDVGRIRRIDEVDYKERYPQICDVIYISCKDNIGIKKLRQTIKNIAIQLPLMETCWLSSWKNVRNELEILSKSINYISYNRYLDICKKHSVDVEEAKSLLKYLHDLGIVLYYHDDSLLKNLVILSSEWGTDAVYKVLDEQEKQLKNKNGILNISDLPLIWTDDKKYPQERYPYLLNLMKKFQLIFDISDSAFLVAELLDNKTINLNYSFEYGKTLSFRYEYDFIPAGIMTRFIVAANQNLEMRMGVKQCWKKGAYLKHRTAYALVKLLDNLTEHHIEIKVSGNIPRDCQELLTIIRAQFENIHKQYNHIKITEKIPCICSENCNFLFDYGILLMAENKGKRAIECHKTLEPVDIRKILDGVESNMEGNYGTPNITIAPQISPTFNNTSYSQATAEASNSTQITIDIRNSINILQGDINDLIGETKNISPEFDKECEKLQNAIKELDGYNTKEEILKSGVFKKIERFIEECNDPNSKKGKLVSGIKCTGKILKNIACGYNKIAEWLTLPQIPFMNK